jgi:chorismate mutase
MPVRGIRGATTIEKDGAEEVLAATRELLEAICAANAWLRTEDVASALFTVTDDIRSVYPARAARDLGWTEVPLTCAQEIPVEGSLPLCIRVLVLWNTDLEQKAVRAVYLREAARLRPDLTRHPEPAKDPSWHESGKVKAQEGSFAGSG